MKSSNTSGIPKASNNTISMISKVIQSKRQQANINQIKDNSTSRQHNNLSINPAKPSNVFSPRETMHKKNATLVGSRNLLKDKLKSLEDNNIGQTIDQLHQNNDLTSINMKKDLTKQSSLKTFFSNTQKIVSTKPQHLPKPLNNQRDVIRRGSQFSAAGYISGGQQQLEVQNQTMPNQRQLNHTLSRIRSAFINFNQNQPSLLLSRTQNQMKLGDRTLQGKIIQQSPSVSSDEEPQGEETAHKKRNIPKIEMQDKRDLSVLSKKSKEPNGSFIETKMKNCLQSRNANESSVVTYKTVQGIEENKAAVLQKNMSQPQLHKTVNITQRINTVKTSFLQRDESQGMKTPSAGKTPDIMAIKTNNDQQQSIKVKQTQIFLQKGDMKSLNLSPIIPQNIAKNQQSYQSQDSQDKTIDTTTRKLDMRKDSNSSKHQNISNQNSMVKNRSYLSLKKEQDPKKVLLLNKEPTTEKKSKGGFLNFNLKKVQKQGYNSQETERAAGAANSIVANDEFLNERNNKEKNITLRLMNIHQSKHSESSQEQKEVSQVDVKQQKKPLLHNQNLIKVTQILNNNNMIPSKRYNDLHITISDNIYQPQEILRNTNTQTPKAVPDIPVFAATAQNTQNIKIYLANEDETTLKKRQQNESSDSSSFDDNEQDQKDFEEFSLSIMKQQEQQEQKQAVSILKNDSEILIKNVMLGQNLISNYNTGAQQLTNRDYFEDRNSIVNYDQSLLTHQTCRENYQSPFSQARPDTQKKNIKDNSQFMPDSFITQVGEDTMAIRNELKKATVNNYDFIQDTLQEQDEEPPELKVKIVEEIPKENDYQEMMLKLQNEEEQTIENLTQRIITSNLYKQMKTDKEKAKFLSSQILEVRKHYKQVFIDNVLKQAKQ